jgi:hypothetical protein
MFTSQDSKSKPSNPVDAPYTIGSPPRKGKLDSIAQIMASSVMSKGSSESDSTHECAHLKDTSRTDTETSLSRERSGNDSYVEMARVSQV